MKKTTNDPSNYKKRSQLSLRNGAAAQKAPEGFASKKKRVPYELAYLSTSFYMDFSRTHLPKKK